MTPQELIKIRENLNLTKGKFASLLNVTPMLYGRYESGSIIIPPHVKENVIELASSPTVEKNTTQNAVGAMKDAARKTAKKTARKVAEMDELVDRAKQSSSVEERIPTPATPAAFTPDVIEKAEKPEVTEKKSTTPKKSRKKPADTTTTSAEIPVEEKPEKAPVEDEKSKKPRGRKKTVTPAVENVVPVPHVENEMPTIAESKDEKKPRGKKPSKQPVVLIESQSGSQITMSDILKKIPTGCESVYIKPEENKAYWVKGDDSGSVDLW